MNPGIDRELGPRDAKRSASRCSIASLLLRAVRYLYKQLQLEVTFDVILAAVGRFWC